MPDKGAGITCTITTSITSIVQNTMSFLPSLTALSVEDVSPRTRCMRVLSADAVGMYQASTTSGSPATLKETLHIYDVVCVASASSKNAPINLGGPYINFKTKPDVKIWELRMMYDSIKSMLPDGSIPDTQTVQHDADSGYDEIRIALRMKMYGLQHQLLRLLGLNINEPIQERTNYKRANDILNNIERMIASSVRFGSRGVTRELAVMRTWCQAFHDWRQTPVGYEQEAAYQRMLNAVRGVYSISTPERLTTSWNVFLKLLRQTGLEHGYAQFSIPLNANRLEQIMQNGLTMPAVPMYLGSDRHDQRLNAVSLDGADAYDGADDSATFVTLEDIGVLKDGWNLVRTPVYIKRRVIARTASFTVEATTDRVSIFRGRTVRYTDPISVQEERLGSRF